MHAFVLSDEALHATGIFVPESADYERLGDLQYAPQGELLSNNLVLCVGMGEWKEITAVWRTRSFAGRRWLSSV